MENVIKLSVSYILSSNIDEHSFANLFTLKNTPISTCLIVGPNKSSLPTNNFLEFINNGHNQDKSSWDYFEDQSLFNMLEDDNSKTIIDIAGVEGVYFIFYALKHNDSVVQQIAEVPVLFLKKNGKNVIEKYYQQYNRPLGFLLYIDFYAMSTLCNQAGLSHIAIDPAMSLICYFSLCIPILLSTTFFDPLFFQN